MKITRIKKTIAAFLAVFMLPCTVSASVPGTIFSANTNCLTLAGTLPAKASLDVPELLQNPELPTGCESVALTIALTYEGYELDKTTIAEEYLIYDHTGNFALGYNGDPTSPNGAGIFPPGLVATANTYLLTQEQPATAVDISGKDFYLLLDYISRGTPVVIWTTMYMMEPEFTDSVVTVNGHSYTWYLQEHCVVLCGYDLEKGTVTVSDPLEGIIERNLEDFARIYESTGSCAMIIG